MFLEIMFPLGMTKNRKYKATCYQGNSFKMTKKPLWVKQWLLTEEKLQALEQLVQEQLDTQHIEESTSPGILLYLLLKRNLENGEW